jgi:hypothetical protein
MISSEQLAYYEKLHHLVTQMRTAHWEAKKYRSLQAAQKEHRLGLEIDKIVRNENKNRQRAKDAAECNGVDKGHAVISSGELFKENE